MFDTPPRVLLSHTSDFGERPARGNSYIAAAFAALDRAQAVVTEMSLLPATERSPMQVSKGLAEETDLYVGIIGWRYGSPVRELPELSYTQLEFRTAAETGVPRLVFLLGERHKSKDASEPNFDRQLAFRREITESGVTVQWFDSPDELKVKLYQSIADPPGWDPAFLRIVLSAVRRAAAPASLGTLWPTLGIALTARRHGSSDREAGDLDPLACAEEADCLVILGGPGAGKSWCARRIASRAAELGLVRLANRERLDAIEIPLFVRIAPFFGLVERALSVWTALVTQAVKELEAHLPNHRCMSRIRRLIEPRTGRYLVILEALDEAAPLRTTTAKDVFETLIRDASRIVLTSRHDRWHGQLDGVETIELQPLNADQVRDMVRDAMKEKTESAALLDHLGRHPALAEASRVPLIAQLIAIVAPSGRPESIRDLYDRAINRILAGEWRSIESSEAIGPYRAARQWISAWAWRAAVEQNDPVSGLAGWKDTIEVDSPGSDPDVCNAIDNLFTVVERDRERQTESRKFLHETFRDHLVAEHIARLSVDEAASALEPHLWYDDRWKSIIPAAIAAHRDPRALLRRILVGGAGDPEAALAAFRARDGLGELGDVLVGVRSEASDSLWSGDLLLKPIFESCLGERGIRLVPAERSRVPDRDGIAHALRSGSLPMPDEIWPRIRAAAFSEGERNDLADAVGRRLVGDRSLSDSGTLVYRKHLAMALDALQPDPAALAVWRSRLIGMLDRDVDDILAAIVVLKPTDGERQYVAAHAIAAMSGASDSWELADLSASLKGLTLTREEKGEVRQALLAGIGRAGAAGQITSLIRAFGSTEPAAIDIAALASRVFASPVVDGSRAWQQALVCKALEDLVAAFRDQDELLVELACSIPPGRIDPLPCELVEGLIGRCSPEGRARTAQRVAERIEADRRWIYTGSALLKRLHAPPGIRSTAADWLLELLQEPGAPWASIGEEIAGLEGSESQRAAAARHLLSRLKDESEARVKLTAASVLARLQPDEAQRQEALSLLREQVPPALAETFLERLIGALAALQPTGALAPEDLLRVLDELESHRLDGASLGFLWARSLVELGHPDPGIRERLVRATLVRTEHLGELDFVHINDRLIDAARLAGSHEAPKRLVGDAYLDILRKGAEELRRGAPVLEPFDLEVILDQFAAIGLPRDQQDLGAQCALAILPDLVLQEPERARRICGGWRALEPPEHLVRQLIEALMQAIGRLERAASERVDLLGAVLVLEPAPDLRRKVAEIVVEEILAANAGVDASM
ncbi:MAG: DUF4062 domain-containing protein, partial [Candidatus Rokuibacteriota bacterium]